MILPMEELMNEVVLAIENMAGQVGLLLMRGLIDQEVEEIAGWHCPVDFPPANYTIGSYADSFDQ